MLYNISHHVPEPTCTKLPFVRSSIPKPYSIDARIITSEDQPLVEMLDKIVMHPHAPKTKKKMSTVCGKRTAHGVLFLGNI